MKGNSTVITHKNNRYINLEKVLYETKSLGTEVWEKSNAPGCSSIRGYANQ